MNEHEHSTGANERLVEERLGRIADRMPPPGTMVEDDVARGRARVRRRGVGASIVGTMAVAAVAGGIHLGTARGDAQQEPPVASEPSTSSAPKAPPLTASTTPKATVTPPNPADVFDQQAALLTQEWLPIMREHLDPRGEHLEAAVTNIQSSSDESGRRFGTRVGWSNAAEKGLGMIAVSYSTAGGSGCGEDVPSADCTPIKAPRGAAKAWAWEAPGEQGVIVLRRDGTSLSVASSLLFGNNSSVPVSDIAVTQRQALALAADTDFTVSAAFMKLADEDLERAEGPTAP